MVDGSLYYTWGPVDPAAAITGLRYRRKWDTLSLLGSAGYVSNLSHGHGRISRMEPTFFSIVPTFRKAETALWSLSKGPLQASQDLLLNFLANTPPRERQNWLKKAITAHAVGPSRHTRGARYEASLGAAALGDLSVFAPNICCLLAKLTRPPPPPSDWRSRGEADRFWGTVRFLNGPAPNCGEEGSWQTKEALLLPCTHSGHLEQDEASWPNDSQSPVAGATPATFEDGQNSPSPHNPKYQHHDIRIRLPHRHEGQRT
jgi:hypothetical protein